MTAISSSNQSLNFTKNDVPRLLEVLKKYPALGKTNEYQALRCKISDSTLTLFTSGKITIQGKSANEVKKRILTEMQLEKSMVLGFDETGRGEDHGPLVVVGIYGNENELRELRDSKKTGKVGEKSKLVTEHSDAQFVIALNARFIDRLRNRGVNLNQMEGLAVEKISELMRELEEPEKIIVDGDPLPKVSARVVFAHKADDAYPCVGAASVLAKHYRNESADKEKRKTWKKSESVTERTR